MQVFGLKVSSFLLAALCGLLFYLWLQEKCNKPTPQPTSEKARQEIKDSMTRQSIEKDKLIALLNEREETVNDSLSKLATAQKKLASQLVKADAETRKWYTRYLAAKDIIEDTGMISVSPIFIDHCDSLADKAMANSALALAYKEQAENAQRFYTQALGIKDSVIQTERKFRQQQKEGYETLSRSYEKDIAKLKPRTKFYGGIAANGDKINPLKAFGFSGSLVTKTEKLYGADFMMQHTGDPLFQIRAQVKIFPRK